MKARLNTILLLFFVCFVTAINAIASTPAGFFIPEPIQQVSFTYRNFNNLIVLPVTINDSLQVNLVLDTGCRNLVLFGKSFQKYFSLEADKNVQFSGLGEGKPIHGGLAINNKVAIDAVLGEHIPIVVVPQKNVFRSGDHIDGVIGYDIFIKFEIELNPLAHIITFRPAMNAFIPEGYTKVAVRIEDARPVLSTNIFFENSNQLCDLMIDTGSSLGLLLKTTDLTKFKVGGTDKLIGRGFNGNIAGYEIIANRLLLTGFEINYLPASITESSWHNHASIGMEVLKEYAVVLNYCKEYICFKKV